MMIAYFAAQKHGQRIAAANQGLGSPVARFVKSCDFRFILKVFTIPQRKISIPNDRRADQGTFPGGASLPDPSRLFNSSLEGNTRRAIDFHEGEKIKKQALKKLIRAAVALNTSRARG